MLEALRHAWICPFATPVTIKGDHRLLGIDLDPEILFGNRSPPSVVMQKRGVNSRHELKCTKFCKHVVTKCIDHRIAERIQNLQTYESLSPQQLQELDTIDATLTKIMLQADRACGSKNTTPWSPTLHQAYLRHRLWSIALSAHRNHRDMDNIINAIKERLMPSPEDELETTRSISANLRHAQKQLRKAKREADILRKKHLENLLNEARASNKRKKSTTLNHLIRAEQNRRCYAALRHHTKPRSPGGLAYITQDNGPSEHPTTIMETDEMNETLLEYSRVHFSKAQGSPFTVAPLNHLLQYDGLTPFGNRVLQGRADLDRNDLQPPTKALLQQLRDKTVDPAARHHPINYEELQNGIKKWPEKTTTSPSGRHLGMYKSLQRHTIQQKDQPQQPPEVPIPMIKQGRDVLYLIFDIMVLALKHTHTLHRWKTVWTMFIEKDLGNPALNLLRCIMIFEADWQLLLKWHSSYGFLPKSEQANALSPAQGGGRKGRSAIDQATQQVVETEIIQLNQRTAIDLFLDARHCFDLMVEACHNMACRRHGAADDYLRLHAQTHRLMKYYVRHKYGVSVEYNTYENYPWHGAGQGAADAALRYIALSDALIDAYHSQIQPWIIHDPTLTITVVKSLKAFIDDVAMSVGGNSLSLPELVTLAQEQLQWWHDLIQASGGALNPKKCCCAIYTWKPDKLGILRVAATAPEEVDIILQTNQNIQHLTVLAPNEGTRYLGIYVTRSGITKPMEDHMWKKAVLYTKAFQRTHMSRREAGVLYRSCFLPALTYPLPATWLPDIFLDRIMKLSTSTILNKMGLHRNLPRQVVFAPRHAGGFGLSHLSHEQGAQKILMLLRHLRAKTPLGTAMETLIRTYQLWAGIRNPILSDTQPCVWIPDRWISHLRNIMHTQRIKIVYDAWTVQPLRHNDRFLMEDIIELNLPRNKLEQLNACRMYLQVTTLAEVTDHTGQNILPQAISSAGNDTPRGLQNISYSTLQWPQIAIPSAACWRLWTRTICNVYSGFTKSTRLNQPLGSWYATCDKTRFWNWRLFDTTHLLYKANPQSPTRMALRTQQWTHMIKFSPTVPSETNFTGTPITPNETGYVKLPTHPVEAQPVPHTDKRPVDRLARQFRRQLQDWQIPLFHSIRKAGSTNKLLQQILVKHPIMIVSDASVQKNGNSGFAWIIAQEANLLWRGMGIAPGPTEDMYSGRAEAYGLLAAVTFLQYYLNTFDTTIPRTSIRCFCDNAGVLTNLLDIRKQPTPRPNDTTNDDRDLYLAILDAAKKCTRVTLQYIHVKGHQDKDPKRVLTTAEQHNVDCDRYAKQHVLNQVIHSTTHGNPAFSVAAPHLTIDGKIICRKFLPALRDAAAIPPYWDYLQKRHNWNHADIRSIQWSASNLAMRSLPREDQRRITLFNHNKLPLRSSKFHPHLGSKLCPSCKRQIEDAQHFLECNNSERKKLFEKLKSQLTAITVKFSLHPSIITTYWLGLLTIRNNTPYPDVQDELPSVLGPAIRQQSRLGWTQLYHGRLAHAWATAIDQLNPTIAPSGLQITVYLTQAVWKYTLETWSLRNQHLHQDAGAMSLPNYRQAVITAYEIGQQLPPAAQEALFHRPLEQLIEQPPNVLRTWLERTNKYMKQQLKAAKTRAKLNTQDIRSFFEPRNQSANDLHPP